MAAIVLRGVMHVRDLAERPIYSARSGPPWALAARRTYAAEIDSWRDVIVCDTRAGLLVRRQPRPRRKVVFTMTPGLAALTSAT
ncbi:hypothetical protein HBB16_04900 [Pseudonocardia sp. MCCB 268]|nr:hypothetical protein [Pseudonocardia cytotoxica]